MRRILFILVLLSIGLECKSSHIAAPYSYVRPHSADTLPNDTIAQLKLLANTLPSLFSDSLSDPASLHHSFGKNRRSPAPLNIKAWKKGISSLLFPDVDTLMNNINQSIPQDSNFFHLSTKADYMIALHRYDSARYYLLLATALKENTLSNQIDLYKTLYKLEKKCNHSQAANRYADSLMKYQDSLQAKIRMMDYKDYVRKEKQEKAQRQKLFIFLGGGMLLCMTILIVFFRHAKHTRRNGSPASVPPAKATGLTEHVSEETIARSIQTFLATQWPLKIQTANPDSGAYMATAEQKALYDTLDKCFADFIVRFHQQYPKTNAEDAHFCILAMLGYKNKTISYCTKLSAATLRMRKSRLKRNLSDADFNLIFNTIR